MEIPEFGPVKALCQAVEQLGRKLLPWPAMLAAARACPLVYFSERLDAAALRDLRPEVEPVEVIAELAAARVHWPAEEDVLKATITDGGLVAIETRSGQWRILGSEDEVRELVEAGASIRAMAVRLEGQGGEFSPRRVLTGIAQMSQDRSVMGEVTLSAGPVAIDALRRALARSCQEGFGKWPAAEGWLKGLLAYFAAQLFVAAEALRHVREAGEWRPAIIAAAAAHFDCACVYLLAARSTALAGMDWGRRWENEERAGLDAAHWGVIYECLRQASYHWRTATRWIAREVMHIAQQ